MQPKMLSYINDTIYFETDIKLTNQDIEKTDVLATIEGALQNEDKFQTFEETDDKVTFEETYATENKISTKEIDMQESSKDAIEELITELASEEGNLKETNKDFSFKVKNREVSLIIKSVIPPDIVQTVADSSADSPKVSRTSLMLSLPLFLFLDAFRIVGCL